MEPKLTSLIIKANKVAIPKHRKSVIETINFLLKREVEINVFLKFIKINASNINELYQLSLELSLQ